MKGINTHDSRFDPAGAAIRSAVGERLCWSVLDDPVWRGMDDELDLVHMEVSTVLLDDMSAPMEEDHEGD